MLKEVSLSLQKSKSMLLKKIFLTNFGWIRLEDMQSELSLIKEYSLDFFQSCNEARVELNKMNTLKIFLSQAVDSEHIGFLWF